MDCKIVKDGTGGEYLEIRVPLAAKPWPPSSTGKTYLPFSSGGATAVVADGYSLKINLVIMARTPTGQ